MTDRLHLDDLDFIASAPEGDARAIYDRAAAFYDHFRDLCLRLAGVAAGMLEPLGFLLRSEVGTISTSGSSVIVALNTVPLKRLHLPMGS